MILEEKRETHDVAARDAVWAQAVTNLGSTEDGSEVQGEGGMDRVTLATVSASAGVPATGAEIVAGLARMAGERGGLPLVWETDNGPAYANCEVQPWLEARFVIWLRCRPHVPTDNPVAEHKNRELKEERGLGKGVVLASVAESHGRFTTAARWLDHGRHRATRGWFTVGQLDAGKARADVRVDRRTFYRAACAAREGAVLGLTDAEKIRQAEQRATWATLESFGPATRVVGPRPRVRPAPTPCRAAEDLVA